MKRLDLRRRVLWLSLLPSILVALLLVSYFSVSGLRTLDGELRARGLSLARYLAPIAEYGIISGQLDNIQSLVQTTVQEHGAKAAIVVNRSGRTVAVSGHVSLASETLRNSLPAATLVAENERWLAYGAPVFRSVHEESDAMLDALLPAPKMAPEVIGHVFIEIDKTDLLQRQQALLLRGLSMVAAALLAIAALAIGIADNLVRPVMRLVDGVKAMAGGQFATRVDAESSGEIGVLERGFNDMARHIEDMHTSLQERIEEATEQLVYQARHDALTGLLNRREFESRLEKALAAAQAGGGEACILFIDLDRFKPVNDTCGHPAGDELLRQIAELIGQRVRESDVLARLGGDEFGVLLPQATLAQARQVAEDICAMAAAYRFVWQDKIFAVGASIGIAALSRQARGVKELLALADAACYQAKALGRNRVCESVASPPEERRHEGSSWPERITSAISEGRIVVDALPILPLNPARPELHLVEIAARLHEPGQPHIPLAALIDTAERYDLAPEIERSLLAATIRAIAQCDRAGRAVRCLVPLSAQTVLHADTRRFIEETLASTQASGEGLCLLISEETAGRYPGKVIQLGRDLARLGCHLALEDFGGGVSSFSHLRMMSPAFVKLTRSLVRDVHGSRVSNALVRAVQEIGADFGVLTIADGVDNLAQVPPLTELKVAYARGLVAGPREPLSDWLQGVVLRGQA